MAEAANRRSGWWSSTPSPFRRPSSSHDRAERFAVVLDEFGSLLGRLDGLCDVVLIGGQVLAIEQVAASQHPLLQVETDTGQRVVRGYSFDPDLLFESVDPEESARWDELPHLLREAACQLG